jgi:hypothetical protein
MQHKMLFDGGCPLAGVFQKGSVHVVGACSLGFYNMHVGGKAGMRLLV